MRPFWKIPRELWRIWQQLSYVFVHPIELACFEIYRRLRPSCQRQRRGQQTINSDIAVFLIYQPNGLAPSVIETCAHLTKKGYGVVLVANGSIAAQDWDRVAPHVVHLIERPNFGYDFGGYRHAILDILNSDQSVENLLIMNDSVWFPVLADTNLLDQMRDDPAPVTGPVMYHHRTPRHTHLQSYLINFDATVVQHTAFRDFWTQYSQTNNKVQTIRRGEMGLSAAMRDAGFALQAMFDQDDIHTAFHALSDKDLRDVLTYEATRNTVLDRKIRQILAQPQTDTNWRDAALALLDDPDWRRYFLTNHPAVSTSGAGFPILKKDKGYEYRLQRKELLARHQRGDFPQINAVVLDEIRALT